MRQSVLCAAVQSLNCGCHAEGKFQTMALPGGSAVGHNNEQNARATCDR